MYCRAPDTKYDLAMEELELWHGDYKQREGMTSLRIDFCVTCDLKKKNFIIQNKISHSWFNINILHVENDLKTEQKREKRT